MLRGLRAVKTIERSLLNDLKKRSPLSHKGDFGRVFIVAGSRGYTGAAHLAGLGALRSGAGLVTIGVPEKIYPVLARREAEVMVRPFPSAADGTFSSKALRPILAFAAKQDVIAAGPGISQSPGARRLVLGLVASWQKALVLDADGLNVLEGKPGVLRKRSFPAVLTPHTGEFVRLFGGRNPVSREERIARAVQAAHLSGSIVLLKGAGTVVAAPDGRIFVNTTGNPGMATGGTGDVLTGIIAAFLGRGLSPFDAARLGAYAHGLAGDLAVRKLGEISLIAGDVAAFLPEAFQKMLGRSSSRNGIKKNGC